MVAANRRRYLQLLDRPREFLVLLAVRVKACGEEAPGQSLPVIWSSQLSCWVQMLQHLNCNFLTTQSWITSSFIGVALDVNQMSAWNSYANPTLHSCNSGQGQMLYALHPANIKEYFLVLGDRVRLRTATRFTKASDVQF